MIHEIFTVFDDKVNAFLEPFFAKNKNHAMRNFEDAINMENHPFHRHPNDYILYQIGKFDDETGTITTHKVPKSVVTGSEVRVYLGKLDDAFDEYPFKETPKNGKAIDVKINKEA